MRSRRASWRGGNNTRSGPLGKTVARLPGIRRSTLLGPAGSQDRCRTGTDPAEKISATIRLTVRRVHEDTAWGKFIARYAMMEPRLGSFWAGLPAEELRRGLASGRFSFHREQIASLTASAGGATFGAISLVLDGRRTWREAGSDTAEIFLRGVGVDRSEARRIAQVELDPLPSVEVFAAA